MQITINDEIIECEYITCSTTELFVGGHSIGFIDKTTLWCDYNTFIKIGKLSRNSNTVKVKDRECYIDYDRMEDNLYRVILVDTSPYLKNEKQNFANAKENRNE